MTDCTTAHLREFNRRRIGRSSRAARQRGQCTPTGTGPSRGITSRRPIARRWELTRSGVAAILPSTNHGSHQSAARSASRHVGSSHPEGTCRSALLPAVIPVRRGNRSPDVVQYGPNTRQNGGAGQTKDQHETTRFTTPLNLQNLHPRFKSGRRLQMFLIDSPD